MQNGFPESRMFETHGSKWREKVTFFYKSQHPIPIIRNLLFILIYKKKEIWNSSTFFSPPPPIFLLEWSYFTQGKNTTFILVYSDALCPAEPAISKLGRSNFEHETFLKYHSKKEQRFIANFWIMIQCLRMFSFHDCSTVDVFFRPS